MNYVIIGNSAAAIAAVEAIRKNDTEGKITIISNEPYHTYSRPLISYLLLGKTTEQKMKYRGDDFYTKNKCETLFGKAAVKIDKDLKKVILDDSTAVPYDKLLVATGSSPFIPKIAGLDRVKHKYTFMSLEDARRLDNAINKDSKVLIVGAGLIGLKCAEGIADKVSEITVVDLAPRILSSILDDDGAAIVQKHIEKNTKIKFMLNTSVKSFDGNIAVFTDNKKIFFDIAVIAVGVSPNIDLIKDIGGQTDRGIIVDDLMQTSIPDIYAAGDCADSFDITSNSRRVLAILPNAYMQGECAGTNMSGGSKEFNNSFAMNAIGFFGLHTITAGIYEHEIYKQTGETYKRLFAKDGVLCGYIIIGDVQKAGIYTHLIREKTPLDTIDFNLMCESPTLLAFSLSERKKKLGGAI